MKTVKKSVAVCIRDALRRDAFRIEPLEPRVLLSADPIFTPLMVALLPDRNDVQSLTAAYAVAQQTSTPAISVPLMARLLSSPAANSAASTFAVDAVLFDAGQMAVHEGFMDTSLRVAANEVLGGSGSLDVALLNTGVVSPGYSPGVLNVSSYTQSADGTLEIQIGGGTAGTGAGYYDQLNVSGAAMLDGKLSISLLNGYKPHDGETFNVLNYGSVTGKFDVGSGLLQSNDGLYFEVTQGASSLTLTAHTIRPAVDYVLDAMVGEPSDHIGEWLNYNYFQDASPLTFTGSLDLDGNLKAQGNFTLGYSADVSFNAADGSALNADVWTLSVTDATAFMGVSSTGLGLTGLDLNLAFVQADAGGAAYGWVMGKGVIDRAEVLGITGVNLAGTDLILDFNLGYGSIAGGLSNDTLLDLSAHALTVGGSTFNANGSTGEYLMVTGTVSGSVGDVSLSALVGVSVLGSDFVMAGKNVTATLSAGGASVGVSNGTFGLVNGSSGIAFEASGALALLGGGFASVTADSARVVINRTGVAQTGRVLSFAGDFSYTFKDVAASSSLQSVSAKGLAASMGSGLRVGGDFYFEKDGTAMRVVARGASALVAAGSFNIGVQQANLGLSITAAGRILEATGALSAELGDALQLSASQITLRLNDTDADASGLAISAGGESYAFGADFAAGARELSIVGAQLSVAGFVQASGSLAVHWAGQPATLNLADGTTRSVSQLWIAGTDLSADVGLNPGGADFAGIRATGLEFVLGLFADTSDATNTWTSLAGTLGAASLSGVSGLTLAASGLALSYNTASAGQRVADFSGSHALGTTVAGKTLTLSADGSKGKLLEASGNLTLDAYGFLQVDAGFAIRKATEQVKLSNSATPIYVDVLTMGASNASVFAGVNGGTADAMGMQLSGVNFALAIAREKLAAPAAGQTAATARQWTALQASADRAAFVGIDGLTMSLDTISVQVNKVARDSSVIDFAALPLQVTTGPGVSETLDIDGAQGALTRVQVGRATLAISDYIYVSGGFYMEMAGTLDVDVATGLPANYPASGMDAALKTGLAKVDGFSANHSRIEDLQVQTLTLSFTDVDIFAGAGPYFIDANGNGLMDGQEVLNPDRMGITLDNIDLALVMMDSTLLADPDSVIPKFYALQLDWAQPLNVDWDFLTFTISDLQIQANQGGQWKGAPATFATPYVDFKSSFGGNGYQIPTSGGMVALNYDRSFMGVSVGHALIKIDDFFHLEGGFAIEKTASVAVDIVTGFSSLAQAGTALSSLVNKGLSADGTRIDNLAMNTFTLGFSNVKLFAGAGPYFVDANNDGKSDSTDPDAMGLVIDNLDLGLVIYKAADTGLRLPKLWALEARSDLVGLIGFDFLKLQAEGVTVSANQGGAWSGTTVKPFVDFQSTYGVAGLSVATGGSSMKLDFTEVTDAGAGIAGLAVHLGFCACVR